MMEKAEYIKAVKSARRVIGFLAITDNMTKGVKISKKSALFLARFAIAGESIKAEWGDAPDNTLLFVG